VIGSLLHILRLARAGFVLAHEGVFSNVDPSLAPPQARLGLAVARLLARRDVKPGASRLAVAIARLGPA